MRKVLIVGGGIAGLTSAILLEQIGYEVEIAEQAEKWEPVGAGIVLWPNCMKVMEASGIREDVERRGNILQELNVVGLNGKLINGFNFSSISKNEKLNAIGIFRQELHRALVNGLKTVKVTLGISIEKLEDKGNSVKVQFTDGKNSEYDFVVGADGIHSKTRELVFGNVKLRYSGSAGWRFTISRNTEEHEAYEIWNSGKRMGIVPIGRDMYYCFSTVNTHSNNNSLRNISIDDYKNLYGEFVWKAKEILNRLTNNIQLIYDDLFDLNLNIWHKGNIVLIGDAAHAITPNLGSGAAMAMEDALSLAKSLKNNDSLKHAFKQYFKERYKRVNYIRGASYWFGKGAQLEGVLAKMRNIFVNMTGRISTPYIIKKVIGI